MSPEDYHTSIDERSTLDAEGYPFWPQGDTVFIANLAADYKNFGTVGWQTRSDSEPDNDGWAVTQRRCLGIFYCSELRCGYKARPKTATKAFNRALGK